MKRHGGKLEGLAFAKGDEDSRAVAITFESRFPEGIIRNRVWQVRAYLQKEVENSLKILYLVLLLNYSNQVQYS